jgi:hypothetical protein
MLVRVNAGARYATVPVELVRQGTGFGVSVGAMEFLEALEDAVRSRVRRLLGVRNRCRTPNNRARGRHHKVPPTRGGASDDVQKSLLASREVIHVWHV